MGNSSPSRKDFFKPNIRNCVCFDSKNFELHRLLILPFVKNQYSPAFIQSCMALKLYETENSIFVGIQSSCFERVAPMILLFHKGKEVSFLRIKNADFQKICDFVLDQKFRKKRQLFFDNTISVIFKDAIQDASSEICFEPQGNYYKLYYVSNGFIKKKRIVPSTTCRLVMDYLKIMANLDVISETSFQEGHIEVAIDEIYYSVKISCMQKKCGEEINLIFSNPLFQELSSSRAETEQACFC